MPSEQRSQQRTACYVQQLMQHLKTHSYSICAITKRMAAANQFLIYLDERSITLETATVAHEHDFLNHKLSTSCRRNGHPPKDVNAWRWNYTSGIHIMLRMAQGQWPPIAVPSSPQEAFRRSLCDTYTQWLTDVRGLAATPSRTVERRQSGFSSRWVREVEVDRSLRRSLLPTSIITSRSGLRNCGGPLDNALCCVCVDSCALSISRA